ncbi:uncharacterized protein LOC110032829 [Phalaenopsis equestris]|uniref:uncharacterized protein LOC110032829 n=1 Tax=Phalaenopsis equestris TaxID=78828 RepID=UPI0009E5FB55|nr:uncharacterized protein LOC110032829 [Phalaenopsis equestris]
MVVASVETNVVVENTIGVKPNNSVLEQEEAIGINRNLKENIMHDDNLIGINPIRVEDQQIDSLTDVLTEDWQVQRSNKRKKGKAELHWSVLINHSQFIHIQFYIGAQVGYATFIYASSLVSKQATLWDELILIGQAVNSFWIFGGDLNCLSSLGERKGGRPPTVSAINRFNDFLSEAELFELGYQAPDFTWRSGAMWERLDRMMGDSNWVQTIPCTIITHLAMAGSDHRPLLCTIQNAEKPKNAPFRFQNMWTLHPHFIEAVYKVWRAEGNSNPWVRLWILQKKVAAHLKKWNWKTIGNLNKNLTTAQSNVIRMEKNFQMGLNSEADLHKASEELLMQTNYTECFLKQKAAVTRFIDGDRKTSYYYACINFRRKNNMILSIHDSNGKVVTDAEDIAIDAIPMEGEIKAALDSIDDHKVVGPDGFTAKIYKTTWNIISGEVVDVVQSFFKGMDPPKYFTASIITLIPKNSSRIGWGDFRPISLTNVLSKVISKVINHRLQPHLQQLICNNQVTFVKGRQISDNILLAQEFLLDLDRKCRGSNLILKLDIQKSYDTINWNFILDTLNASDFSGAFIILATKTAVKALYQGLTHFQITSGKHLNKQKCQFFTSSNTLPQIKQWIAQYTGFRKATLPINYLGVQLIKGRSKQTQFNGVIDQIQKKLQCWTNYFLLNGGRITLLKSILTSIPSYALQMFTMEKGTHIRLGRIFNKFLWAGQKKQFHWLAWNKLCKPLSAGGLGFKDFQHLRTINLCKLWINFRAQDSLWALFMKGKYCRTVHSTMTQKKMGDSRLWTKLMEIRNKAEDLFIWELGEGQVNFWLDNWVWNGERLHNSNPNLMTKVKEFWIDNQWNCNLLDVILTKEQIHWPVKWGKLIWGKWLTPSMSFFCWTLWKSLFPTDDILKMKGLKGPSCCQLCSKAEESLDHLFFSCSFSQGVWSGILKQLNIDTLKFSWNQFKYENNKQKEMDVVLNCTSYLQKIIKFHNFPNIFLNWVPSVQKLKVPTLVLWNPPPEGWLKANTDGSFCKEVAGVGGIFRNSPGKCMLYFSSPTWAFDALETEMIAFYCAIYLAKHCNIIKLIVESESFSCIRFLNQEEAAPWNVARWTTKIQSILSNVEVIFQHILREGNTPAHNLTAKGKDNKEIFVGTIPSTQHEILLHGDSLSIPYINCRG